MKEYPRKFETVTKRESYRLAVHGGWHHVYTSLSFSVDVADSVSSIFIPDPNHEWKLEPTGE